MGDEERVDAELFEEYWNHGFVLEREASEDEHEPLAWLETGVASVFCFVGGWCEPLSVEVVLGEIDETGWPGASFFPFCFARKRQLPLGATPAPTYECPTCRDLDVIDENTTLELVRETIAANGARSCLRELEFHTMAVRFPAGGVAGDATELRVLDRIWPASIPIERRGAEIWIAGPASGTVLFSSPIAVRLSNDFGLFRLHIGVSLSTWEVGGTGRPEIERGVERLLDRGWQMSR